MARYLLDTRIVLWWLSDRSRLAPDALAILNNYEHSLFLSIASLWEIRIKQSLGKLEVPDNFLAGLQEAGIDFLPVQESHTRYILGLAHHHRDPFDRILVAQARIEQLTLITADKIFTHYTHDFILSS